MSRIFILSSNTAVDPYPVYPLGMAVVSGVLQAAGHQVMQHDCLAQGSDPRLLEEKIRGFAPDLLALSLRNIDNVDSFSGDAGWFLHAARELVTCLRRISSVPIVVGGPALTIMPEAIADYLQVDHAIVGEAERSFPELVAALERGEALPQVILRGRPVAGAEFGCPLYEPELVQFYHHHSGMLNLQTKRGCPYRCSYCSYPHLEGGQFRVRDPHQVVAELKRLKSAHGTDHVFFTDSVFNDPRGEYLQLVEEILRADLDLKWSAFFRPQGFGQQELKLMKRAGLYALELGTDAASDITLAGINKGLTFSEVLDVNHACIKERLPAAHFVMFGVPDETEATVIEGLENMNALGESVVFAFSGIRILPEAPLHRRAISDGVIAAEAPLLKPVYYFSPQVDRELMEQRITAAFAKHRNRIFPPSEGQIRMQAMNKFGFVGLMWDRLVRFPRESTAVE
ncbi:MAG: lipid biosynthesis B12-binding/radical SAM protein [Pelovirga sp.]